MISSSLRPSNCGTHCLTCQRRAKLPSVPSISIANAAHNTAWKGTRAAMALAASRAQISPRAVYKCTIQALQTGKGEIFIDCILSELDELTLIQLKSKILMLRIRAKTRARIST